MNNLGEKIDDTEVDDLIKIFDKDGDNKISSAEFMDMFTMR